MKAIAITPGIPGISLVDRPEPEIQAGDEIKIKVLQVGICGTDREEASGGRALAPENKKELIIGHEMIGEVVTIGSAVKKVKPGDFALFTVRRGCNQCAACLSNRSDMCYSGLYIERGIKGADGYQAAYVVDKEQYVVKVPDEIANIGVLTEPMSVAAKAMDEARLIQSARLKDFDNPADWLKGKKALVAGIGPIGILTAFALRLQGAEVYALDIVNENSLRPAVLKEIGGTYIDGRIISATDIDEEIGQMDFVFEATGIAKLQIQLIDTLGVNSIYIATGIPAGIRPLTIPAGDLMKQLVLKNQIVIGSVNASIYHYEQAIQYLTESKKRWPDVISKIITQEIDYTMFNTALQHHGPEEIKVVVKWT